MSHLAGDHFTDLELHQRSGNNDVPTIIDAYALEHLHPATHATSPTLRNVLQESKANGLPDHEASPTFAKFMALQCKALQVKRMLELGTLGGSTAIWIALFNPQIKVVSIEIEEERAELARQNCKNAGVDDRVEVITGKGIDVLTMLETDVEMGQSDKFGYVFIDADKRSNWEYFDKAVKMSISGGCIIVDNVVRRGDLVDPTKQDDERVQGSREVIEKAGKDTRVEATLMQTVGEKSYDGFLFALVK